MLWKRIMQLVYDEIFMRRKMLIRSPCITLKHRNFIFKKVNIWPTVTYGNSYYKIHSQHHHSKMLTTFKYGAMPQPPIQVHANTMVTTHKVYTLRRKPIFMCKTNFSHIHITANIVFWHWRRSWSEAISIFLATCRTPQIKVKPFFIQSILLHFAFLSTSKWTKHMFMI